MLRRMMLRDTYRFKHNVPRVISWGKSSPKSIPKNFIVFLLTQVDGIEIIRRLLYEKLICIRENNF